MAPCESTSVQTSIHAAEAKCSHLASRRLSARYGTTATSLTARKRWRAAVERDEPADAFDGPVALRVRPVRSERAITALLTNRRLTRPAIAIFEPRQRFNETPVEPEFALTVREANPLV